MGLKLDGSQAAVPKLPLWQTIRLSYGIYFAHFNDVLRASAIWIALVALTLGGANWLQWSWLTQTIELLGRGGKPELPDVPINTTVLLYFAYFILSLAGASVAVAWHRGVVLGERPALSGGNIATKALWRYAGIGLVVSLGCLIPALLILVPLFGAMSVLAPKTTGFVSLVFTVAMIVAYVLTCMLFLRLTLLLPARATDDLDLTFRQCWRGTRGNTWRLFWGGIACLVPPVIPMQIAFIFVSGFQDPAALTNESAVARLMLFTTLAPIYYLLTLPVCLGFLSLSYQHFFKRPRADSLAHREP